MDRQWRMVCVHPCGTSLIGNLEVVGPSFEWRNPNIGWILFGWSGMWWSTWTGIGDEALRNGWVMSRWMINGFLCRMRWRRKTKEKQGESERGKWEKIARKPASFAVSEIHSSVPDTLRVVAVREGFPKNQSASKSVKFWQTYCVRTSNKVCNLRFVMLFMCLNFSEHDDRW